ncbi:uncharacterized protein G2W53_028640 [Senna tora]|uniref:Uncharacterized protein n=1 Tax=Senna tora TaxID=362788 RepID=A0A834WD06_9FABA|nr:uncharacterized protein G2W53_028640 [Senna tora]
MEASFTGYNIGVCAFLKHSSAEKYNLTSRAEPVDWYL